MKNNIAFALILALAAPAAAQQAAPGLPPIDAAAVRALPLETGVIRPVLAKDFFDGGPAITPVEDADYVCQDKGGGYAIRAAGRSSKIWQLDGLASGAEEGLELGKVFVDMSGLPQRLDASGYLSFGDQELKIDLSLRRDQKTGGMALTAKLNGQASPLKNVPCRSAAAPKAYAAGPAVRAEGRLFSYNRATRQFDIPAGRSCAVTLKNFRSYNDTEHGSPRDVVSADYVLEGFADLGNYVSGNAVGTPPEPAFPYVSFQNYLQSGLTKGVDVRITMDGVSSAAALLARPLPPVDVYVTKENSMTSYFGGDGVKWGYWCDLRGGRP